MFARVLLMLGWGASIGAAAFFVKRKLYSRRELIDDLCGHKGMNNRNN